MISGQRVTGEVISSRPKLSNPVKFEVCFCPARFRHVISLCLELLDKKRGGVGMEVKELK